MVHLSEAVLRLIWVLSTSFVILSRVTLGQVSNGCPQAACDNARSYDSQLLAPVGPEVRVVWNQSKIAYFQNGNPSCLVQFVAFGRLYFPVMVFTGGCVSNSQFGASLGQEGLSSFLGLTGEIQFNSQACDTSAANPILPIL